MACFEKKYQTRDFVNVYPAASGNGIERVKSGYLDSLSKHIGLEYAKTFSMLVPTVGRPGVGSCSRKPAEFSALRQSSYCTR